MADDVVAVVEVSASVMDIVIHGRLRERERECKEKEKEGERERQTDR